MLVDRRDPVRPDRRRIRRGGRRAADAPWMAQCIVCGSMSGRAFNLVPQGFMWCCQRCAHIEQVLPPASPQAAGQIVLWRMRSDNKPPALCLAVPLTDGWEMRLQRGRAVEVSEIYRERSAVQARSLALWEALVENQDREPVPLLLWQVEGAGRMHAMCLAVPVEGGWEVQVLRGEVLELRELHADPSAVQARSLALWEAIIEEGWAEAEPSTDANSQLY